MYILSTVDSILYLIGKIQTTVYCLYNLLLNVGHVIVLIIVEVFRLLSNIISTSGDVLRILKEDFEVFQHDLLAVFAPALKWIQDGTMNVFICGQKSYLFFSSMFKCFNTSISVFLSFYQYLKWGVDRSSILFLDSLCLIGNAFMYCLTSVVKLFSMDTLTQLSSILYFNFIHIIRMEALCGVMVLTCLTMIGIKYKIHLKTINMINIIFLKFIITSHHGVKLSLMFFPLLLSAVIKNWNSAKYVLFKHVRKKDELAKIQRDDLQKLLEAEKAEKLCVICMDRKRNIILLHCQHLILCDVCVLTILQDNALCPVCRRVIFDIITVYT